MLIGNFFRTNKKQSGQLTRLCASPCFTLEAPPGKPLRPRDKPGWLLIQIINCCQIAFCLIDTETYCQRCSVNPVAIRQNFPYALSCHSIMTCFRLSSLTQSNGCITSSHVYLFFGILFYQLVIYNEKHIKLYFSAAKGNKYREWFC